MPRACTACSKVVWAFFTSQEAYDTFMCQECIDKPKEVLTVAEPVSANTKPSSKRKTTSKKKKR